MASDWLLSLLLGTAVYGSVRTVVWKDGMGSNPMPPIRSNEDLMHGVVGKLSTENVHKGWKSGVFYGNNPAKYD